MRKITALAALLIAALAVAPSMARQPGAPLTPGFNLFSTQQDIQLGQEAASQVRQKVTLVQNQFLQDYLKRIGQRLASTPEAGKWPFTFTLVLDPSINAFALPGGPMFVNSGTIVNAGNEAQIAGVMGHEMSHVILRHGTKQASKANLLQIPVMLAGAIVGNGSLLGELTKIGIGVGANSILLKYSRDVTDSVCKLVELHLRFYGYGRGEWTDSAVRRYVTDAGPLLDRLHKLVRSDCTTRNRRRAAALQRSYDSLEGRIAALRAREELAAIRNLGVLGDLTDP